jgi:hypothetical protein
VPIFKIHTHRPTRFPSRYSLKHPHYFGVPFRQCRSSRRRTLHVLRLVPRSLTPLPLHVRDLLAHAKEVHCPDSSLYELLQQKNVNILVASNGGHKGTHCSFGWVIGTKNEVIWDCEGTARGYPMQSYRAEEYGRILFLTHYIRYNTASKRRTTYYVSRLTATIPVSSRPRKNPHPGRGLVKLVLETRPRRNHDP